MPERRSPSQKNDIKFAKAKSRGELRTVVDAAKADGWETLGEPQKGKPVFNSDEDRLDYQVMIRPKRKS